MQCINTENLIKKFTHSAYNHLVYSEERASTKYKAQKSSTE